MYAEQLTDLRLRGSRSIRSNMLAAADVTARRVTCFPSQVYDATDGQDGRVSIVEVPGSRTRPEDEIAKAQELS